MLAKDEFPKFLDNLVLKKEEEMLITFRGVVKKLNQIYWKSDSEKEHAHQVGSYGRSTSIDGSSDLDMLFVLPNELFKQYDEHEGSGQSALLQDVRKALLDKYPDSDIKADGQVVVFNHSNYVIEIVPCFLQSDGTYKHADTNDGGSWGVTDPNAEIKAIDDLDSTSGNILRCLCKMMRAWKNKNGVPIGGFLIDTLAFNFITEKKEFHNIGYEMYSKLCRDFFDFLATQKDDQEYWLAPGSNKRVYKNRNFTAKAKKAKNRCDDAINKDGNESVRLLWKRVFGRQFPNKKVVEKSLSEPRFRNTEEFIEDRFPISIKGSLTINCRLTQDGFRTALLRNFSVLKSKYSLEFFIESTSIKEPYELFWKVLNIGSEAEKRDMIRGQISKDKGQFVQKEASHFKGEHIVDAYIVKNGFVVARDTIPVNIDEF